MEPTGIWNRRFVFLLATQAGFGFAHSAFMMLPKWMATVLDAGPEAIGRVVAASAISIVFFLVPAGVLVDRHGRKRFLFLGAALMSGASACYVSIESIGPALYGLRIAQSLGFAFAFAGGGALCIDAAPRNRIGQAVGLFGLSYVVMGAFAPAAVEAIVARSGWDAAFLLAATTAGLCALGSLFVYEAPRVASEGPPTSLVSILHRPALRWAILVVALLGIAFGCAMNFHQPWALSLGLTDLRDFFIANSVAAAACRLGLGPYLDRLGLRRISFGSLLLYAVVMVAIIRLDLFGLAVVGFGMGLAHGLFYPAYTGMVLSDCPPDERGRRMALIQAGLNVGIGIGGIALGWIAEQAGYPVIFGIASLTLLAGAALILLTTPSAAAGVQPVEGYGKVSG